MLLFLTTTTAKRVGNYRQLEMTGTYAVQTLREGNGDLRSGSSLLHSAPVGLTELVRELPLLALSSLLGAQKMQSQGAQIARHWALQDGSLGEERLAGHANGKNVKGAQNSPGSGDRIAERMHSKARQSEQRAYCNGAADSWEDGRGAPQMPAIFSRARPIGSRF